MSETRGTATTRAVGHWDALAAVFEGALALPAADRAAYLEAHCPDPRDRDELSALLDAHADACDPVSRAMSVLGRVAPGWHTDLPRTRVGPYEILREIGRGGMGVVYLARRADGLYHRLVALKLARVPVLDQTLRGRFLAERDILAGLAHPNIAPLFDGGVTEDGLPYFTMEFVDGVPIDVHCDRQALDLRARTRLFLRICSAVAAAHRALVVHRDLKPTNVLVTEGGDVKLLDFGIAKLLERESGGSDTVTSERLMTPAYASPEQVRGQPVSTATDVYALGLLLYELLCGRRAQRTGADDLAALEQAIVRDDPPQMADALRQQEGPDAAGADVIARARQTSAPRLARLLRGDLARITAMALRKDPDQRYATAAHLADDLQRYLDGRAVVARGHSMSYRARRFARRHRLPLAAAAVLVASLLGYLSLTVRHARQMEQAAAREQQEAVRAREVADFLVGLFEANDPNVLQNRAAPIAEMLNQGLARANALSTQPQLQARLFNAIGRVYVNLGRYKDAAPIAARALEISRGALGETHADVARDYRLAGLVAGMLGDQAQAATHFRAALAVHQSIGAGDGVEAATDLHNLGYALAQAREVDEGERYIVEALGRRRALLPAGHEDIAMSVSGLAFVRNRQGRPRESVELYREALAMRIATLGERHPEVARARQNLASSLSTAGGLDEAASELGRALDVYRAVYGERHPSIATTLNNLGILEARRNREEAAVRHFQESFEMRRELLGPRHPSTLLSQANLASTLGRVGRAAEGERLLSDALDQAGPGSELAMGLSPPQATSNLAHLQYLQGKFAEAESTARRARAMLADAAANPLVEASVLVTLGRVLIARRQHDEAGLVLQRALEIRRARLGPEHADTRRVEEYQRELDGARRTAR